MRIVKMDLLSLMVMRLIVLGWKSGKYGESNMRKID